MPQFGRVIGTIWAGKQYPGLESAKIQLLQPTDATGSPIGTPIGAVDTIGAGPGEFVLYVTAYEAVIPFYRDMVPIDASMIAIIDTVDLAKTK